jgi:hypothetical protein
MTQFKYSDLWRAARRLAVVGLVGVTAACLDMDVVNVNNPDAGRALSDEDDVQSLLGSSFARWWRGTQDGNTAVTLVYAGEELTTGYGHANAGNVTILPRSAWPNQPGVPTTMDYLWGQAYGAISQVNDALSALDEGMNFGPGGSDNLRARAFGRFVQGLAHGSLALTFDRAYILDESVDVGNDVLELRSYGEVMEAALAFLREASELAGSGSFTISSTWVNGLNLTDQDVVRLSHSYSARFLAAVARTPEERGQVNWAAVISHANQGITQDFAPVGDGTTNFWDGPKWRALNGTARVSYTIIGPADTTGAFEAWYNGTPQDRVEFDMEGPDLRIHAPGDPTAPGTHFRYDGPSNHPPNHPPYKWGRYMTNRYTYHLDRTGPMPAFLAMELDFLRAEAHLRLGERAQAAELLNRTRVDRGGLPPAQADDPLLLEKLMYDKRIELLTTAGGLAYFDARGWGILHERSPIHFPIPALQLELIGEPAYSFGGDNAGGAPARSTHPVALTAEDLEILRNN